MLPLFEAERKHVNHGGAYRVCVSNRGQKAQLESVDLLGLALWYLKSRCAAYRLCNIFGVVPSTVSVWLDYALEVLYRVVRKPANLEFAVTWPTESEMLSSAGLLETNRPLGPVLRGIFAVMDGGRMPCVSYTDPDLQNACWESFTQAEEVTKLFV